MDYNTTLETNVYLLSGILTHNPSKRATADLCLRPRGHWDWHMDLIPYLLTPWSRVLEQLISFQLVKFPAFYGTQRFVTTFTSARHLSLS